MKTEKSINWSVNQIDNFKYANIHFYSEFLASYGQICKNFVGPKVNLCTKLFRITRSSVLAHYTSLQMSPD